MASGDRKVKVQWINIERGNPMGFSAQWAYFVEDNQGVDTGHSTGLTLGDFGTTAEWRAMTGSQMETDVLAAIQADPNVPPNDSIS